jgi:hypothetical protein
MPPVQISTTEIIKILKFQATFNLNDKDSFKIQQIIHQSKANSQQNINFNTLNTGFTKIKAKESFHEHSGTIISHSIDQSNFKGRQEVQDDWNVRKVVHFDNSIMENRNIMTYNQEGMEARPTMSPLEGYEPPSSS